METRLLTLVLHKTTSFFTQVVDDEGEKIFQILKRTPRTGRVIAYEFTIAYIKGSAESVCTLRSGVAVDSPQTTNGHW